MRRVVPDSAVIATLDQPPGEPDHVAPMESSSQPPIVTMSQPRIIPTHPYEAVLAFTLSSGSRGDVRLVLKPAGEEPMSQKLIYVKGAEVLTPSDVTVDAIDGEIHLNQPQGAG